MEVLELKDPLIKKYVDSVYVIRKNAGGIEYTAYPVPYIAVGLFRDTIINGLDNTLTISPSPQKNHIAIACNGWYRPLHLRYLQMVDEIAINFTPIGFVSFTQAAYQPREDCFTFSSWSNGLASLFDTVFATNDNKQRTNSIEAFLWAHYIPQRSEAVIDKAIQQLSDFEHNYSLNEIAENAGVHYKELYRMFKKMVGCSPAHYRKVVRFRQSVYLKLKKEGREKLKLADICYRHNYFDPSYFTKQFQELTGEKPTLFFKSISLLGKDKIVWKLS